MSKAETSILEQRIGLQPVSDRIGAWPEDDWTGITNQKERRRIQNRLNQKVCRLRKKTQAVSRHRSNVASGLQSATDIQTSTAHNTLIQNDSDLLVLPIIHSNKSASLLALIDHVHILKLDTAITIATMEYLERIAQTHYLLGSPRTDLLLRLIQFNFTKALIENTRALGLTSDQLHDDAISPFNTVGPWKYDFETLLPSSLRPTMVQRTISHHPWLDILPSAQMRDNLIIASDSYDEMQLCLDMKSCSGTDTGRTGIIVWGDPWDPRGWEITESFARAWGWVFSNCSDLFQSTNHWRAMRNERPLFAV